MFSWNEVKANGIKHQARLMETVWSILTHRSNMLQEADEVHPPHAPQCCPPSPPLPDHPLSSLTSSNSCPLLHPAPSPRSRRRKSFAWCAVSVCEASDPMTHTCRPSHSALSPPLKANLVAAFEQSLTLMTARLQTLSVSSDQKVSEDASWNFYNL